ncbi:MAG: bacillithiol biosynthesis deacetylase BshB1 [Cyclobacteriaceae bacterium]|jgi:bacillithiol biosynthesis deacetylase BshB1|nr:bacillithiol biosynthesis deacetylase BshB1 [Cyclobacteriaceae bacterium]
MKLDILVLAAHPDDAELGCGGTIASHVAMGYKVGIVDFTRGELGTRGTPEIRSAEAAASAKILGLSARINLGLKDGFFGNTPEERLLVVRAIRKFRPQIVLANAISDRHPDHPRAAELAFEACFSAGLVKVQTTDDDGNIQEPWRPSTIYHYIQSEFITPDLIVDVTDYWGVKMKAIQAFTSQFYNAESTEPETYISSQDFLRKLEARATDLGHSIGVKYGEGFTVRRFPGVRDITHLL